MRTKKRLYMWYEVQRLTESGLNKSQIKRETGLDRATIRKYQQIREDEFHKWVQEKRRMPKKLQNYHNYVKNGIGVKALFISKSNRRQIKREL